MNLVYDADIIEKLSSVPNVQGYIKQLIREDIARTGFVPKNKKEEGIKMTRIYGNTSTHLNLTGTALKYYNLTDPIRIVETEEDGEYTYQVFSGHEPMHDGEMTEEQLIRWMEDGYAEYRECLTSIHDLALNWIHNADSSDIVEIDLETAAKYVSWMDSDINDTLQEDITPEKFMEAWNDLIREEENS